MANRVFASVRRESLAALLVAAGAVGGLTACGSSQPTTYRPAAGGTPVYQSPSYNSQPQPAPSGGSYTQPAPAPRPPSGGQMACGKGKCG
jgi:hypothetical protein